MTYPTIEDIELLEHAARASGIRYDATRSTPHPVSGAFFGLWLTYDREPSEYDRRQWNPLTDDGDCARLEAALKLDVTWDTHTVSVRRLRREGHISVFEHFADHAGHRDAARRRATLRCAAKFPPA